VLLTALILLTAGCSGTVTLDEPAPAGDAVAACDQLMAALPDQLLGQPRRDVSPGRYAAAWGSPTITLRCGVSRPAAMVPGVSCFTANGIDWFPEEADGGSIFTAIGRAAMIEVRVPERYQPPGDGLLELAPVITTHDPDRGGC